MSGIKCQPLFVKGAFLIEFPQYRDSRGFFEELYNVDKYPSEIPLTAIQQLSCSHSKASVFRGLHCSPYYKLVTCVSGEGYDFVADCREDSPTYLRWVRIRLSAANHRQVFVPPGCGHGFYSMRDNSILVYAQGGTFSPVKDRVVTWKEPVLGLELPHQGKIVISEKDEKAEGLNVPPNLCQPNRKRILIIGASGKLGSAICSYILRCDDMMTFGTHFEHRISESTMKFDLEIAASDIYYADEILDICCPHVVVICGSWTNVGYCDVEPAKASAIMTAGPANVAKMARKRNIKVVAISTDYVFDGKRDPTEGPYNEDDEPNPTSTYGKNKFEMEKKVLDICGEEGLIIRTSTVNGKDCLQSGSFYTLYNRLTSGKEFFVPVVTRSPTYVTELAEMVVELIKVGASGVVHCCGDEVVALPEYFRTAASAMELNSNLVKLREKNEYQPVYSPLSSEKRKRLLPDFKCRTTFEAVRDWLKSESEYCQNLILKLEEA